VAGTLGYCGLDRRRQPLAGDEIRECWEAWPGGADPTLAAAAAAAGMTAAGEATAAGRVAPLEFIEIHGRLGSEPIVPGSETTPSPELIAPDPDSPPFVPPLGPPAEPGWSLWGDLDR
jgi:hypothetical protein